MAINTETGVSSVTYNGVPLTLAAGGGGLQYTDFSIPDNSAELREFLMQGLSNKQLMHILLTTPGDKVFFTKRMSLKIEGTAITPTITEDYMHSFPQGTYMASCVNFEPNNKCVYLKFDYFDNNGDSSVYIIIQSNNTVYYDHIHNKHTQHWMNYTEIIDMKSSGIESPNGSVIRIYYQ